MQELEDSEKIKKVKQHNPFMVGLVIVGVIIGAIIIFSMLIYSTMMS